MANQKSLKLNKPFCNFLFLHRFVFHNMFSGFEGFWKHRNNMEYISFYVGYEVVCKIASFNEFPFFSFYLINKQQLHYNASNHAKNMNQGLKNVVYLIFSYKLSLTLYMLVKQAFLRLPLLLQSRFIVKA